MEGLLEGRARVSKFLIVVVRGIPRNKLQLSIELLCSRDDTHFMLLIIKKINMKISVITPTYNRPEMLKRAIRMFLLQDHADKEMIIVGPQGEYDKLASEGLLSCCIKYLVSEGNIGMKRNLGCAAAEGDVIVHCDDDDLYAPDWLGHSANELARSGADCVGLHTCYFFEPPSRLLLYRYTGRQGYAVGATLCYRKKAWEANPFPEIQMGEDTAFVSGLYSVANHEYIDGFCAVLHGGNTCSQRAVSIMKEVEHERIQALVKSLIT